MMKQIMLITGIWLMTLTGCGLREREKALEKKISEVNQKEQELLLRERSLAIKEENLIKKEKILDSASSSLVLDSSLVQEAGLPATWSVNMRCTETNCHGSAVGDTKNEQWQFSYQNNVVIARAMSDHKLIRVYTGGYNGNLLELSAQEPADPSQSARMEVQLQKTKENEMAGQRVITRADGCRIVYALTLNKQ